MLKGLLFNLAQGFLCIFQIDDALGDLKPKCTNFSPFGKLFHYFMVQELLGHFSMSLETPA